MTRPNRAWRPTGADLWMLRQAMRLTQRALARKLAMSERNYIRCENGLVLMSDLHAIKCFRRLAVPLGIVPRRSNQ